MASSFVPNPWLPPSNPRLSPAPPSLVAVTSTLYLSRSLHDACASHLRLLLSPPSASSERSQFESGNLWRVIDLNWFSKVPILGIVRDAVLFSGGFLFGGEERAAKAGGGNFGEGKSRGELFDGRMWTNVFLALNLLVYAGQVATEGKLFLWGAKVNSLIGKGQIWRLVTSAFMHANVGHLMINSYSLNSIGPTVEQISGPRRFVAIYLGSAIASSLMSYKFVSIPSVGASGAIFGLVGSFAVFLLRHRNLVGGGKKELLHVANVIAVNMAFGFVHKGIDNWAHLGGLLGGAAISWFLGPAWKYQARLVDGRLVYVDRAPIFRFINRKGS